MKFYALWDKGRACAPDLVQWVFECWEREVGAENFIALDGNDLARAIANLGLDKANLGIAHRSDVLRAKLLAERGGVWIDASLLPMPGSGVLLRRLVQPSGFFALRGPGQDRLISNFLLAASPGNPLAQAMFRSLVDYHATPRRDVADRQGQRFSIRRKLWLRKAKRDPVWSVTEGADAPFRPYFAFHYIFARLVQTDPVLAAVWNASPPVSALPALLLQRVFDLNEPSVASAMVSQILPLSPFHKLSWKKPFPEDVMSNLRDLSS